MPREVNAPRVYESPLPTRSLSSNPPAGQPSYSLQAHVSPSVPSNSLNRSGSIPYAKPGSSGSRNGPPAGYQNATVTKGSALRHSMKPRPSATDAVIVGKDRHGSTLLTPPSSQDSEDQPSKPFASGQARVLNIMDRENSQLPHSPIYPSTQTEQLRLDGYSSTPNARAGPSKPRYSARTFFDDEELSSVVGHSTTPSAAPPTSQRRTLSQPAASPLKSSTSRKRNIASQQLENSTASPRSRSKKQIKQGSSSTIPFATPEPSSSALAKKKRAPRTDKPAPFLTGRRHNPLSKSLSHPTLSTSATVGRKKRRSTPHVNGKPLRAPMFVIPDFVPKGTSMDPDPPPPPQSPGDDPILLVGNWSTRLSQPPDLDEEGGHVGGLDEEASSALNPSSKEVRKRLSMLDESSVKSEDGWDYPGFESGLGMADEPLGGTPFDVPGGHAESESEEDQDPDMSYAPGSASNVFSRFSLGLVPGLRDPIPPSLPPPPRSPPPSLLSQAERISIPRSSFSPLLPDLRPTDEDEDIMRFSVPPLNSSRSPTVTRSASYSSHSPARSKYSQTPPPRSSIPSYHPLTIADDIMRFSIPPTGSSVSPSKPRSPPVSSRSSRSSRTPVPRSKSPRHYPLSTSNQHPPQIRPLSHSPPSFPTARPAPIPPRPLVHTPFHTKKAVHPTHTPAPVLSPYVFQPPGTPESYSGSSEEGHAKPSVDNAFELLDRQWAVGHENGMEDEVDVIYWARKIRSSLSPDSEDEEEGDETVVMGDTGKGEEAEQERKDVVLMEFKQVVEVEEEVLESQREEVETRLEPQEVIDVDRELQMVSGSSETGITVDVAPVQETELSLEENPQDAEEALMDQGESDAEDERGREDTKFPEPEGREEEAMVISEPQDLLIGQPTGIERHVGADAGEKDISVDVEVKDSHLPTSNHEEVDPSSLRGSPRLENRSVDSPSRFSTRSPSISLSELSPYPVLPDFLEHPDKKLSLAQSLTTTPSLSPPLHLELTTLGVDAPPRAPSPSSSNEPAKELAEPLVKADHSETIEGAEDIEVQEVDVEVEEIEEEEDNNVSVGMGEPGNEPFNVLKASRRRSLAEEMSAAGEKDERYAFNASLELDSEELEKPQEFMDGVEEDEGHEKVVDLANEDDEHNSVADSAPSSSSKVSSRLSNVYGPNDPKPSFSQDDPVEDLSLTQDDRSVGLSTREPLPMLHSPTPRDSSPDVSLRTWAAPPSPTPSSSSSISESQEFSFLGKTQDFIVELNDLSDESLDEQIENIIQERSLREMSFRMDSPEPVAQTSVPQKISSDKLSSINELFRKRHLTGHTAMSTPPQAGQTTSTSAVSRPTVIPMPLPSRVSLTPFRGSPLPSKSLRGGLRFPSDPPAKKSSEANKTTQPHIPSSTSTSSVPSLPSASSAPPPASTVSSSLSKSLTLSTSTLSSQLSASTTSAPRIPSPLNHPWSLYPSISNINSGRNQTVAKAPSGRTPIEPTHQFLNSQAGSSSSRRKVPFTLTEEAHRPGPEEEDQELETYIKITSNNPKEAARATAFLKLFHDYVETEFTSLHPDDSMASTGSTRSRHDPNASTRSRANKSSTSYANLSIMSAPELLMEAEQDIAAEAEDLDEGTYSESVNDLSIPGSFQSQSSFVEDIRPSGKARERSTAGRVWGSSEWRSLMSCLDAEGGGRTQDVDADRVVDRFLVKMGLTESDLAEEWEKSKLIMRVTSIQTRRQNEALDPATRRRRSFNPNKSLLSLNKAPSPSFAKIKHRATLRKGQSLPTKPSAAPSSSIASKIIGFISKGWKTSAAQLEQAVSTRSSSNAPPPRSRNPSASQSTHRRPRPCSPVIIPPSSPLADGQSEYLANSSSSHPSHPTTASRPNSHNPRRQPLAPYAPSHWDLPRASSSASSSSTSRPGRQKTPLAQHPSRIQPRPLSIAHLPPKSTLPPPLPSRSPTVSRRLTAQDERPVRARSQPIPIAGPPRPKANDLPIKPRSSFEKSPPKVSMLRRSFESAT